jgi:two-component system, chemotaxis family, sensor kinase Cph1
MNSVGLVGTASCLLIALAACTIALALVHVVRRMPMPEALLRVTLLMGAVAAFLLGLAHLLCVLQYWIPLHGLRDWISLAAALVAVAAAAAVVRVVPGMLATNSPGVLERINAQLQREIEARREFERNLERTVRELERSNRELEQFAYITSHDLKAPLRSIASFAQLLERRYGDNLAREAADYTRFIRESAGHMQSIIDDLLQLSRLHAEHLTRRMLPMAEVVHATMSQLQQQVNDAGAEVEVTPLPDVCADEAQMELLIRNLISNAIKFQPPGGKPRVRISAINEGDLWRFEVADNGIGIPPEECVAVFDIFRRLHNQEQYPGTGIGLALCKRVVERHGGSIWVEPVAGGGSAFRFTVPMG